MLVAIQFPSQPDIASDYLAEFADKLRFHRELLTMADFNRAIQQAKPEDRFYVVSGTHTLNNKGE